MPSINCPICGKDDMVQKVTAIVQGETHTTSGYSSTFGTTNIDGNQKYYTSSGDYAGRGKVSGNAHNSSFTRVNAIQQSTLAQLLTPQFEQPTAPRKPIIGLVGQTENQIAIKLIPICLLIGIIVGFVTNVSSPFGVFQGVVLNGLGAAFFIWVGINWIVITFFKPITKEEAEKRLTKYRQEQDLYQAQLFAQQQKIARWSQTYYCRRDDVIYIPGEPVAVEPARMRQIL
jgi:hypothetical protein